MIILYHIFYDSKAELVEYLLRGVDDGKDLSGSPGLQMLQLIAVILWGLLVLVVVLVWFIFL